MSRRDLADRYALAFVNLCEDLSEIKEYTGHLEDWGEFLSQYDKVRKLVEHPITPFVKKRSIIEKLENFAQYPDQVKKFILYLIQKERIDCFPLILDSLHKVIAAKEDVIRGTLRFGSQLSTSARKKVIQHLEKQLGKKLQVKTEIDTSLLGGMVLQTENKILDASIKNNFKRFLEELKKGA